MTDIDLPTRKALLYEVLKLSAFEGTDAVWWRLGTGPDDEDGEVHIYARCSDVFEWGTADLEEITIENLPILRQAIADVQKVTGDPYFNLDDAFLLFVARVRGQRPQGAYYKHLRVSPYVFKTPDSEEHVERAEQATTALRALFDAAGPERRIDILNPKDQDGVYRYRHSPSEKS